MKIIDRVEEDDTVYCTLECYGCGQIFAEYEAEEKK
jgi:hypothetical protein